MNLDKIHYFFKAAEYQNFSKAAADCHIAQTTMSKFIAEMEEELGICLFQRMTKSVSLTEEGKAFYNGMRRIYAEYEALLSSVRKSGPQAIHIGVITRDYAEFPILHSFEKEYNDLYTLQFRYDDETKLLEGFKQGSFDALICPDFLPVPGDDTSSVQRCSIGVSDEVLVYAKELEDIYGSVSAVIESVPFITKTDSEEFHNICRKKLQALTGGVFRQLNVVKEYHQQVLLVNLGKGFAIVPDTLPYAGENICMTPLPEAFDEVTHLVFRKDTANKGLQALTKYINRCLTEL